ncbi:MAG TPA: protein translocase subunit SecF [Longimicrobiales bacterium]|nr:protein translocase subunit SecF [Longimicrobiales bacterium]
MRFFTHANYKFIEKRRTAYLTSAVAILVGIGAMVFNVFSLGNWQNYGVDFTGGALVQVHFETEVTVQDVRSALGGVSGPEVTRFSGENEFIIRAPLTDATIDEVRADIENQLTQAFGPTYRVSRGELVGPKIGGELQTKAAMAILFSFVLTLIYLAIRFELRFGMAAVIATVHDILITLGFLALFRVEIMLPTVAAILTVVGYSLNDTIVVFDRIRENLGKKGARKQDQVELVNRSINETLPRTVLTSGTTLAVLVALLVLGPAVIRDFSLVLILGVVIGTYSSIFVASPALLEIQKRMKNKGDRPKTQRAADALPV